MFTTFKSSRNRLSARQAWTLIDLMPVIFVIVFVGAVAKAVREKYGQGPALVAGVLAVLVGIMLVTLFYRLLLSSDKRQLRKLREKYRTIYQVKTLPTDVKSIVKPKEAEIRIGDYGWDARPNRRDGLIHLQGLTLNWKVVWHAGFRQDQIEKVATKTASQYDYWFPYWAKPPQPPPCPYPVQERKTPTMGLPHHSGRYFERYPSQDYPSQKTL